MRVAATRGMRVAWMGWRGSCVCESFSRGMKMKEDKHRDEIRSWSIVTSGVNIRSYIPASLHSSKSLVLHTTWLIHCCQNYMYISANFLKIDKA